MQAIRIMLSTRAIDLLFVDADGSVLGQSPWLPWHGIEGFQVQCKLTQWPESMIIGSGEINDRIHETIYLYTMSVVQP